MRVCMSYIQYLPNPHDLLHLYKHMRQAILKLKHDGLIVSYIDRFSIVYLCYSASCALLMVLHASSASIVLKHGQSIS